jgi:hypothetical protein
VSSDPGVQAALEALYGTVDNIDPWVGGLAEDHLPGSSTGALVTAALVEQFTRLRDGDRFFYLGEDARISKRDLGGVIDQGRVTLAQIIRNNSRIGNLPANVFFVGPPAHHHAVGHTMAHTQQAAISADMALAAKASIVREGKRASPIILALSRDVPTGARKVDGFPPFQTSRSASSSRTSTARVLVPDAIDFALASLALFEDGDLNLVQVLLDPTQ